MLQASILLLDVRTNNAVEDVPFQTAMVQNMSVSTYKEKVFILVSSDCRAALIIDQELSSSWNA